MYDNYALYSYNTLYYTQLESYTPLTSGSHTISLTSVYDNYLYVLDPRSGEAMQFGVEYDDDSGVGNNASLTTYFSNEVTYLIVFCQYNPSTPFINLNEGDDCTITFGLNT